MSIVQLTDKWAALLFCMLVPVAAIAQEPQNYAATSVDNLDILGRPPDVLNYVNLNGQPAQCGRIVDYSGDGLVLKVSKDRQLKVPPARVRSIKTRWPDQVAIAEKSFADGDFETALAAYQQAYRKEKRRWAKKMLFAETIWCLRNLNRTADACDRFHALAGDDPRTPFFDAIPLAWVAKDPEGDLRRKCEKWLDSEVPAVRLMAASHLIPTEQRARATDVLTKLSELKDEPLRTLAVAQRWRTQTNSASADDLTNWDKRIRTLRPPLRSGPAYVLGKGWAARSHWDRAAIAFLQAAIPHERDRQLTVESIWAAANALGKQNHADEAATLLRELTVRFPGATLAVMAREKLQRDQDGTN